MNKSVSFARSLSAKIILATSVLLALVLIVIVSFQTILVYINCKTNLNIQSNMVVQHIDKELKIVEKLSDNAANTLAWMPAGNVEQLMDNLLNSNENIKDASIYLGLEKTRQTGLFNPNASKDTESGEIHFRHAQSDKILEIYKSRFITYEYTYEAADIERHQTRWIGPYMSPDSLMEFSYITASDAEFPETDMLEVAVELDKLLSVLKEIKPYKNTEIFVLDKQSDILFSTSKNAIISDRVGYEITFKFKDESFDKYKNESQFYVNWADRCIICRQVMNNG